MKANYHPGGKPRRGVAAKMASSPAPSQKPPRGLSRGLSTSSLAVPAPKKKKKKALPKKIAEAKSIQEWHDEQPKIPYRRSLSVYGMEYNGYYHDHPDYAPEFLTPKHKEALKHYTSTSAGDPIDGEKASARINGLMRHFATPHDQESNHREQNPHEVIKGAKDLLSMHDENSIRKPLTAYSGIPPSFGEQLLKKRKNSKGFLAGFTSSSTDHETVPFNFAHDHAAKEGRHNGPFHIVQWHLDEGAGTWVASQSGAHKEDEVLIPAGAKTTHLGSEIRVHREPGDEDNPVVYHIHHIRVHRERLPIEQFPRAKKQ